MFFVLLPTTAEVGGSQVRIGVCHCALLGPLSGCNLQGWQLYHFPGKPVPMLDKMLINVVLIFFLFPHNFLVSAETR